MPPPQPQEGCVLRSILHFFFDIFAFIELNRRENKDPSLRLRSYKKDTSAFSKPIFRKVKEIKNKDKAFIRLLKMYNHTKVRKKVSISANLGQLTRESALLLPLHRVP